MKLSLSIPAEDVEFLDRYASENALPSRSAAIHAAIRTLRAAGLATAYAQAWEDHSSEASAWDAAVDDGLS